MEDSITERIIYGSIDSGDFVRQILDDKGRVMYEEVYQRGNLVYLTQERIYNDWSRIQ